VANFYDKYLEDFNRRNPSREVESFAQQQKLLFEDGFSACHYFAEGMAELGHETMMVVANDQPSQEAWRREHAPHLENPASRGPSGVWGQVLPSLLLEILLKQIQHFEPDVLYLQDPISFDSRFIEMLSPKPRLVMAWRAAEIPKKTNFSSIDILVSNDEPSLEIGKMCGARWQEHLEPGFPARLRHSLGQSQKTADVTFTGQLSIHHDRREKILVELAEDQLRLGGEFGLVYAIRCDEDTPAGIAMHGRNPVYGEPMYRFLANSKICLNAHLSLRHTGHNMRMFEATGVGAFLLTDQNARKPDLFRPGIEVETFANRRELHEKILYFLAHEKEREAIAVAGQKKCLENYSLAHSAKKLEGIAFRGLEAKTKRQPSPFWNKFRRGLSPIPGAGQAIKP
jgi:hypothetical protein